VTHKKHTTIVDVKSDDKFLYIATVIGPDPNAYPHMHKMPKLTLSIRAAEYNLDVEDPLALDMVLREHLYFRTGLPRYDVNGVHPLFYLPSVGAAASFMEKRIEEVRVDRKAPEIETGNRMLAGAVENKAASKGLVAVRDQLLLAQDSRIIEPVQFYRDQSRESAARPVDPVELLVTNYRLESNPVKETFKHPEEVK
jgi:hypothetical protein